MNPVVEVEPFPTAGAPKLNGLPPPPNGDGAATAEPKAGAERVCTIGGAENPPPPKGFETVDVVGVVAAEEAVLPNPPNVGAVVEPNAVPVVDPNAGADAEPNAKGEAAAGAEGGAPNANGLGAALPNAVVAGGAPPPKSDDDGAGDCSLDGVEDPNPVNPPTFVEPPKTFVELPLLEPKAKGVFEAEIGFEVGFDDDSVSSSIPLSSSASSIGGIVTAGTTAGGFGANRFVELLPNKDGVVSTGLGAKEKGLEAGRPAAGEGPPNKEEVSTGLGGAGAPNNDGVDSVAFGAELKRFVGAGGGLPNIFEGVEEDDPLKRFVEGEVVGAAPKRGVKGEEVVEGAAPNGFEGAAVVNANVGAFAGASNTSSIYKQGFDQIFNIERDHTRKKNLPH